MCIRDRCDRNGTAGYGCFFFAPKFRQAGIFVGTGFIADMEMCIRDKLMCTEFWVGWFDHWGNGGHMTGNLEESVKDLDKMLELGHVNIYKMCIRDRCCD